VFAAEWGTGQVALAMLWLAAFVIWAWLAIVVFADLFGHPGLSGAEKALWVLCVVLLPFVGVLVYVLVRVRERPLTLRGFAVSPTTGPTELPRSAYVMTPEVVDALRDLAARRDAGEISAAEYVRERERLLA
jgi:hypothetical protein